MKKLHLQIFLLLLSAVIATGCSSHKKATVSKANEYEQVLRKPLPNHQKNDNAGTGDAQGKRRKVVEEAERWIGVKYSYGGDTKNGVDCSGLVFRVFESIGMRLPRDSRSQQEYTTRITKDVLVPGDLVFFSSKGGGDRVSHVGIYVGKQMFIHASTSRGVIRSGLDEDYYVRHYHSSGRVSGIELNGGAVVGTPSNSVSGKLPSGSKKPSTDNKASNGKKTPKDKKPSKDKGNKNKSTAPDRPGDKEYEAIRNAVRDAMKR